MGSHNQSILLLIIQIAIYIPHILIYKNEKLFHETDTTEAYQAKLGEASGVELLFN